MLALLVALAGVTDSLPPLVSTAWLADRLADPALVVLHISDPRGRAAYDSVHIPGARFLDLFTELVAPPQPGGLTFELPSAAQLDSVLEAKGVSDGSLVVVYSPSGNLVPTARTFFTLEYAGLRGRVAMLDGGLGAWTREGRPTAAGVPVVTRGTFTPRLQPAMVVDAAWIAERLHRPGVAIVDARAPNFYNGAETRQARSGRIPGADNLPFNAVIGPDGQFRSADSLRTLLVAAGARPGDTVVTYCHIGQQASLAWFTARLLGYHAMLYDGSFQDWSARLDLPVEVPPTPPPGTSSPSPSGRSPL
jgi:thiosulfate/3-mercaptopyruvate sulfurtransferase